MAMHPLTPIESIQRTLRNLYNRLARSYGSRSAEVTFLQGVQNFWSEENRDKYQKAMDMVNAHNFATDPIILRFSRQLDGSLYPFKRVMSSLGEPLSLA